MNEETLCKSQLKERGWTDSIIKEANLPFEEKTNPYYKCAAPMRLYKLEDVEAFEATKVFETLLEKAKSRKKSGEKAVETKLKKTMAMAEKKVMSLKPPRRIEIMDLRKRAFRNYNYIHSEEIDREFPFKQFLDPKEQYDDDFEKRVMTNYVRHCMMEDYDKTLHDLKGLVGKELFYDTYKDAIMDAIYTVYPELILTDRCPSRQ